MKTTQTYKICDNLIGISELQDNSIDLTVTSPPYDNLRTYNGYSFDFEKLAQGLYRVTKTGGVVVWIVGDQTKDGSETGTSFRQALYFKEIGFNIHDTMIYSKRGFANPSSNRYHQIFEYMFVFSKGTPKTFNPIMDRKNKCAGATVHGKTREADGSFSARSCDGNIILPYGARCNVWEYSTGGGNISTDKYVHEHPGAFPEKLVNDHILSWSNEGDIILDPFLGSGTTLRICRFLKRNGIGFEINEGYETMIKERLLVNTPELDAWTT